MVDCVVSAGLLLYLILGAIVGMVISLRKIFKLEQTILSIDQKLVGNLGLRPVKLVTSKKPVKKKVTKRKAKKRR